MRRPSDSTPRVSSRARSTRVGIAIAAARSERRRRFVELAAQAVDVGVELLLERARELLQARLLRSEHLPRVLQLLLDLVVADLAGRFLQLARRVAGFAREFAGAAIELLLQADATCCRARPCAGRAAARATRARRRSPAGCCSSLAMSRCSRWISSACRCASLTSRSARAPCVALQLALHVAQPIGGGGRLPGGARIAAGRGAPHRVGCLLHLPRGLAQVGTILLARQPFELPRRFLGLLRQRALQIAAARVGRCLTGRPARCRCSSCSWRRASSRSFSASSSICWSAFCCIACWLVSYWFAILSSSSLNKSARSSAIEPAPPPPPPPPALRLVCTCSSYSSSACCRYCSALFSGGSAASAFCAWRWPFGRLHLARRLRQQLGDLLERRIRRHQPAVHPIDQALHLLAQPALRQREHDQGFLDLVGASSSGDRAEP